MLRQFRLFYSPQFVSSWDDADSALDNMSPPNFVKGSGKCCEKIHSIIWRYIFCSLVCRRERERETHFLGESRNLLKTCSDYDETVYRCNRKAKTVSEMVQKIVRKYWIKFRYYFSKFYTWIYNSTSSRVMSRALEESCACEHQPHFGLSIFCLWIWPPLREQKFCPHATGALKIDLKILTSHAYACLQRPFCFRVFPFIAGRNDPTRALFLQRAFLLSRSILKSA